MKKRFLLSLIFCISLTLANSLGALEPYFKPTQYIWNHGMGLLCDVKPSAIPYKKLDPRPYTKIRDGDVVWVRGLFLEQFAREVFPKIKARFVLFTHDTFLALPDQIWGSPEIRAMAKDPRILHWFTQNYLPAKGAPNHKIGPVPQGLDFSSLTIKKGLWGEPLQTPAQQEEMLKEVIAKAKPTNQRIQKVISDFHLHDTTLHAHHRKRFPETRTEVYCKLKNNPAMEFISERMQRRKLWELKTAYAFSISPHGRGLDCHRTWEDLCLGCIIIVKASPLDPLYEGLPVVILKDWSEINEKNLEIWAKKYGDALNNPNYREKLTNRYWMNKVKAVAKSKLRQARGH